MNALGHVRKRGHVLQRFGRALIRALACAAWLGGAALSAFAASTTPTPGSTAPSSVPSAPVLDSPANRGPDEAFDAAARLYEQGRPVEAAAAYERLLNSGVVTAALWFNLGNASLQANQIGRAIAAYRHALRLSPRDPEILANLARARGRVGNGATTVEGLGGQFLRLLTPNEWAAVTIVGVWLWFGILVLREFAPKLKARTTALVWIFAVVGVGAGTAALAAGRRDSRLSAVVIAPDSAVRYGPLEESQSPFSLPDGAEVVVTDRKGDWLEIRDAARRRGWIMARNVSLLPEARPAVGSRAE